MKLIDRMAVSAPVRIGDNSVIGLRVHLRKGTQIPPDSHVVSPAGMPPHRVYELERSRGTRGG